MMNSLTNEVVVVTGATSSLPKGQEVIAGSI